MWPARQRLGGLRGAVATRRGGQARRLPRPAMPGQTCRRVPWAGVLACPCASRRFGRHGQRSTAAHGTRLLPAMTARRAIVGRCGGLPGVLLMLPLLGLAVAGGFGCDRRDAMGHGATTSPTTQPGRKTVASLVPAATDLLLGMGAGDRLVAGRNYDVPRGGLRAAAGG